MAETDQEKTEAPTPRRLAEARERGNVVKSADLTASVTLLASMLLLYVFGMKLLEGLKRTVEEMLWPSHMNLARADDVSTMMFSSLSMAAAAAAPFVLCLFAAAMIATVCQVGFLFTTYPLMPKFDRLSPLRGLKNIFDLRAVMRLVMSMLKVIVIAGVATLFVLADVDKILMLAELEPMPMFGLACKLVFALGLKLALLLFVLAIIDYSFQRWRHYQDMRITKQDLKEELKRMDGDPLTKQRRSRVARQLAMQRINQAVPKADVIVTNPTHFAIALRYDSKTMRSPKVVAKGADFMAMRIRQLAIIHGVPMVERRELAQALYKGVEVGQEVPPQFYSAIAEILAYVYRLSGRKTA